MSTLDERPCYRCQKPTRERYLVTQKSFVPLCRRCRDNVVDPATAKAMQPGSPCAKCVKE